MLLGCIYRVDVIYYLDGFVCLGISKCYFLVSYDGNLLLVN